MKKQTFWCVEYTWLYNVQLLYVKHMRFFQRKWLYKRPTPADNGKNIEIVKYIYTCIQVSLIRAGTHNLLNGNNWL